MDVRRMAMSLKHIEISMRFSMFEGADFSNFRTSRFLEVWQMYSIQFFALFLTVATRICSTKQMMVYDQITFFNKFFDCVVFRFFDVQKSEAWPKKYNSKTIWSNKLKKNENLWKKELAATPYHRINNIFWSFKNIK